MEYDRGRRTVKLSDTEYREKILDRIDELLEQMKDRRDQRAYEMLTSIRLSTLPVFDEYLLAVALLSAETIVLFAEISK